MTFHGTYVRSLTPPRTIPATRTPSRGIRYRDNRCAGRSLRRGVLGGADLLVWGMLGWCHTIVRLPREWLPTGNRPLSSSGLGRRPFKAVARVRNRRGTLLHLLRWCGQQNMALWRSWLARRPVTAEVAGSSPVRSLHGFGFCTGAVWPGSSVGERPPEKRKVAGSIPALAIDSKIHLLPGGFVHASLWWGSTRVKHRSSDDRSSYRSVEYVADLAGGGRPTQPRLEQIEIVATTHRGHAPPRAPRSPRFGTVRTATTASSVLPGFSITEVLPGKWGLMLPCCRCHQPLPGARAGGSKVPPRSVQNTRSHAPESVAIVAAKASKPRYIVVCHRRQHRQLHAGRPVRRHRQPGRLWSHHDRGDHRCPPDRYRLTRPARHTVIDTHH